MVNYYRSKVKATVVGNKTFAAFFTLKPKQWNYLGHMLCSLLCDICIYTFALLDTVKARRFNINKLSRQPNDGFIP